VQIYEKKMVIASMSLFELQALLTETQVINSEMFL